MEKLDACWILFGVSCFAILVVLKANTAV